MAAFFASGVQWNMFSVGMVLAYPATLLPALASPETTIKIDQRTASWIASMPGVSGLIPIVLLGPLMHFAGRKVTNICVTTPIIIGWLLTYFAATRSSISMLLTGRFLQGLCLGTIYFISVCIGEFSAPKTRSILLGIKPLSGVLGVTLMHAMAFFLDWQNLALVGAVPPTLALLTTLFWPNTPEWLVSRGRYEEAETVFYSLRGYSEVGEKELHQMIESEKARRQFKHQYKRFNFWMYIKSKVLWRPVGVLNFAVLVPAMGGRQFISSYSVHLATQISGDDSKGYHYMIIADAISVVAALINLYLLKVCSRRHLLFGTGFLSFGLLAACSAMLYIRTSQSSEFITWLTLSLFALYYFFVNVGVYPVSYVLMGEIFPLEYRALGSVVDGILGSLGMVLVISVMPWLERTAGTHGMLLTYGCGMLLCLVYLYFELPETKNRTLHDVGEYFRGKSPKIRRADDLVVNVEENKSFLGR